MRNNTFKTWTEKKVTGRPIEYALVLRPLTEEELMCAELDIAFDSTFDLSLSEEDDNNDC